MRIPLPEHPAVVAIAALVIGLLVWGFWPQPVAIEAIVVQRAPLTITIEEEGRSRVIDRYIISAPVDGVACACNWMWATRCSKARCCWELHH